MFVRLYKRTLNTFCVLWMTLYKYQITIEEEILFFKYFEKGERFEFEIFEN